MSKVPANVIGLSTTIGIQQPIGTYGGQIYLQKWCQPMVFPDVLYWPINYCHRYLKAYRHLCCLQKWCQPMVEIVFPDVPTIPGISEQHRMTYRYAMAAVDYHIRPFSCLTKWNSDLMFFYPYVCDYYIFRNHSIK